MIGTVVDEFAFPVEAGKVREFARAIGAGVDTVPLTFTAVAAHHRDARAAVEKLGLDIKRVVVGEVEWEYARPLVVGDTLHGRRVVVGVRERGAMTFVTLETEFVDGAGKLALRQREVLIQT